MDGVLNWSCEGFEMLEVKTALEKSYRFSRKGIAN
jgi:hypothetical protein